MTAELADRAITLARRVGDPLRESAALDQLTSIRLARGEIISAAESSVRRTKILAEGVRDLPFHQEAGHLATARLLVVAALAGDWGRRDRSRRRFLEGWELAGRPRGGNGIGTAAEVAELLGDAETYRVARQYRVECPEMAEQLILPRGVPTLVRAPESARPPTPTDGRSGLPVPRDDRPNRCSRRDDDVSGAPSNRTATGLPPQ